MEETTASLKDFPTDGVELRCFLVVNNYARSLAFYRDVLGATVVHELPGILCFLHFAGSEILLSAPGSSIQGSVLPHANRVISELSIRVPDCQGAYKLLGARGAQFITPPAQCNSETRAFFLDPDGRLLEIWEAGNMSTGREEPV